MERMNAKDLATRTRTELLAIAKQLQLRGVSRLRKEELLDRVSAALSPHARRKTERAAPPPSSSVKKSNRALSKTSRRLAPVTIAKQPVSAPPVATVARAEHTEQKPTTTFTVQPQALEITSVEQSEQNARTVEESKFFLGPQPHEAVTEPTTLPASYNDNHIVLLVRDPHWLYAYWDFNGEHFSKAQNQLGSSDATLILRVFDVTYVEFNGANAWSSVDVELTPFATNWYVSVPQADAAYCAEIGYRSRDNQFVSLGRSNVVTTPRAEASLSTTVRWFTPPERRAMASADSRKPHSRFAEESYPAPASTSVQPAPSSAEHPFSWGTVHRP
jgi:hypothetical protein